MSKVQLVQEDLGGPERSRDSGGFGSSGGVSGTIFTMSNFKRDPLAPQWGCKLKIKIPMGTVFP